MDCPNCHQPIDDTLVIKAGMSALGKRGKGPSKARPSHLCKKAAKAGWAKRARQAPHPSTTPPLP